MIIEDIHSNLIGNNQFNGWTFRISDFQEQDLFASIKFTGESKTPFRSSKEIRYPNFQILFCSATYTTGYAKADQIYKYLHTATIANYIGFTPKSGILDLGKNKNDLHVFSINFDSTHIE